MGQSNHTMTDHSKANIIVKAAAQAMTLPVESLKLKTRKREIVVARQIAMKLMRIHTALSLQAIGDFFNKDHATVLHGSKNVDNWKETKDKFYIHYLRAESIILSKFYVYGIIQETKYKKKQAAERVYQQKKTIHRTTLDRRERTHILHLLRKGNIPGARYTPPRWPRKRNVIRYSLLGTSTQSLSHSRISFDRVEKAYLVGQLPYTHREKMA
ncbi:MAG: helix-turn-helix domain-containing protein [Promethearchaeota archaeon]|jgi:hypothetical protein